MANVIIMLGLVFGISLLFAYLTSPTIEGFLAFAIMFDTIFVSTGLVEVWTLVALILGLIVILFSKRYVS